MRTRRTAVGVSLIFVLGLVGVAAGDPSLVRKESE